MHEFILPPKELSHFVKRIYEINIPRPSTFEENRVIPMGMGTITIVLKGNPRIKGVNGIRKFPKYALGGQYFPTFSFDSDIPLLYYGIALKPTATYKLFGIYLADIQNDFISLDQVIGEEANQIWQQLIQTKSTESRLLLLSDFMLRKVPNMTEYTHLDVVIDYIYEKKGILKVKDLCDYEDVSRRYLEKTFKKFIGFTPGQFIRQVRFNFTCSEIAAADTDGDVDQILMKFGYYDRSHFMKKFKKYHSDDLSVLTGDNPSLFKTVFSRIMRSDSENSYHP
ncbi:helix-turn-helix domain-containing protein [Aliifodinibius salicampi]|uniref:Helix-turn-helix domain-containing protein n=1 Tax=Fodinibius salicampi TaxID=1920655 RepID=A0ABT3Q2X1_9BACT|nr:helix-turn-helix domain-containing protein [Fodinibius salicampi]MCW9714460.1 helix-turn-helix domain-containing protein [Fodinibius salicampi]